jgi:hypothetical protein
MVSGELDTEEGIESIIQGIKNRVIMISSNGI